MARLSTCIAVAVFAVISSLTAPSVAQAIVVGPGDPIRTPMEFSPWDGYRYINSPMCSTGVPGYVTDRYGQRHRIMLTAGHCLNDSPAPNVPVVTGEVFVPTEIGDRRIGTAGAHRWELPPEDAGWEALPEAFNGADYGVIVLDPDVETTSASYSVDEVGRSHGAPVAMTGVKDFPDLPRGEISVDNFGQPICKDGSRTGRGCGTQIFRARNGVWTVGLGVDHGDSGGNAYDPVTNEVIGINSMTLGPVSRVQPADIALEEAYGIPDGQVNSHFQVSDSVAQRDTPYRTVDDDIAADNEYIQEQSGANAVLDVVHGLSDVVRSLPELSWQPEASYLK